MATSKPSREAEPPTKPSEIISALNHPIRRSSLRLLLEKAPASATQIGDRISDVTHNNLRFHLDLLVTSGMATKEKRVGVRTNFYSPNEALRAPWVGTVLKLTAGED
jgi:DNA-binding transcriptional ArsR family regulator